MAKRADRRQSMAQVALEFRLDRDERAVPEVDDDPEERTYDGRVFTMVEYDLAPDRARQLAADSRFVVHDRGDGCEESGYRVWKGRRVQDLLDAGEPVVYTEGSLRELRDPAGAGLLVVGPARWGPLRSR